MAILKDLMVYGGARVVGDSYLANVTATKFVKEGGTDKLFLMADGSVTTLTGDDEVDLTKYLPLTAGPGKSLTRDLYLTGGNVSPAIVFNRTNGWDYKIFNDDSAILRLLCNRGTDTWTDYSYFNGPNLAIGNNTLNNLQSSVGATTNSGNIYLWSTGNANGNGNRGLWVDAHGTGSGKSIITVDTNNNATLYGNLGWSYITSKPVMFTDFSSELPDDYNSGAGTKGWFRIMKGLNTMSHPIRFRIFSTYNSILNSGFEFCLIPRYSGTFRLVQINGYTSSTNNDGGIPIGKIRIVRKSTNDSPRYFYIDFYYNATSKNTVHVLFDYYPYTSSSYVFQAPTRVNSLESGEVVNYTLLLDSGSHTNGNIQASKFIKILENNELGEDVLLANGNTITQDQLRTQTNNPTGSDLSIWGVQYCDSLGIFKSVTDSLKMPSGKYIKASITDSSGTAILYYESGNILGAFGNGTTTNISTYIRSTGDNLYHRLGNSSNFNDYLIFDTNNYINYAVSLSGTQTITGLKTFNNEVKISSTLNFLSSSNYINIPSDSKLCFSAGGTTSGNWKFIIDPPSGPGSYYIFRPAVDLQGYLGNTNYKWGGVYASNFYGTASNVSTTADTSNTLYLVGVTSSATTTLKRDTSITIKGGIAAFPNNGGIQIKNYEGNYMSVITAATANYKRINIGDNLIEDPNNAGQYILPYELNLLGSSVYINGNTAIHSGNYTTYLPFLNSTTVHATKTSKIYAPTSAGTANYILKSNGSGAPTWTELSDLNAGSAANVNVKGITLGADKTYYYTFVDSNNTGNDGANEQLYTTSELRVNTTTTTAQLVLGTSGSSGTSVETGLSVASRAGSIGLYSGAGTSTNKYLRIINALGTSKDIITIDLNNSASFNGNATSATTATNLKNKPSIQAGTTDTSAITITAGEKTSNEFTVPFATTATSATSCTNATKVKWSSNSSDYNYPLAFCTTESPTSGNYYQNYYNTDLTYNPNTKTLTTGHILPLANNTYNLGSDSYRLANIYTNNISVNNNITSGGIIATNLTKIQAVSLLDDSEKKLLKFTENATNTFNGVSNSHATVTLPNQLTIATYQNLSNFYLYKYGHIKLKSNFDYLIIKLYYSALNATINCQKIGFLVYVDLYNYEIYELELASNAIVDGYYVYYIFDISLFNYNFHIATGTSITFKLLLKDGNKYMTTTSAWYLEGIYGNNTGTTSSLSTSGIFSYYDADRVSILCRDGLLVGTPGGYYSFYTTNDLGRPYVKWRESRYASEVNYTLYS